jgi:hypothetical protein
MPTPRPNEREDEVKRLIAACGMFVLIGVVALGAWSTPDASMARSEQQLNLTVSTWNKSDSMAVGDTCGSDLLIGGPEYSIYRQVVVRDEAGTVVGVSQLTQGVVRGGDWGLRCDIDVTMALPDRPFFTFEISEDDFTVTVPLADLEDAGWEIALQPDY